MPRLPRTVAADTPYHVTQRGNRREQVFFSDADRTIFLRWLREYSARHGVEILAYCLMPNHVHLVAVPSTPEALHRALKPVHMRHAQRINRTRHLTGHVWQGRFFSAALDEAYLWAALRYVDRNPVRAGMVGRAEEYPWSSARVHCGLRQDSVLTTDSRWLERLATIPDWSVWLADEEEPEKLETLRIHTMKGSPCTMPRPRDATLEG